MYIKHPVILIDKMHNLYMELDCPGVLNPIEVYDDVIVSHHVFKATTIPIKDIVELKQERALAGPRWSHLFIYYKDSKTNKIFRDDISFNSQRNDIDMLISFIDTKIYGPSAESGANNFNILVKQLTSEDSQLRKNAALSLKNLGCPAILNVLAICSTQYKLYQYSMRPQNAPQLTLYDEQGQEAGYTTTDTSTNNKLKTIIDNNLKKWDAALDGGKLYLLTSHDSVESGIIELLTLIASQNNTDSLEQAQYIIKYGGADFIEPLLNTMKDSKPEIRAGSILLLSVLNDVRSYDPIKNALNDNNLTVRNAVASAMSIMHIPISSQSVIKKETIKEIVKIPCKYCGTLIENTSTYCPSCGAPLNPFK